jgi:hypothetical protein
MWSEIHYIDGLGLKENYLKDDEDVGTDAKGERIRPLDSNFEPNNDGKTLLHLLYWLAHTREGRDFFHNKVVLKPAIGEGTLEEPERQLLVTELTKRGVTDERIQSAIVESHVAAVNWVRVQKNVTLEGRDKLLEKWGKIYLQQTAFITWCLWEDAKGHEFSLLW